MPADIPQESAARVRETAKSIYRALGCTGIARVDMFLTEDGRVILNEVNTMPGMTSYSRYPRMMAAAGMPLTVVIDQLVTLAFVGRPLTPARDRYCASSSSMNLGRRSTTSEGTESTSVARRNTIGTVQPPVASLSRPNTRGPAAPIT